MLSRKLIAAVAMNSDRELNGIDVSAFSAALVP